MLNLYFFKSKLQFLRSLLLKLFLFKVAVGGYWQEDFEAIFLQRTPATIHIFHQQNTVDAILLLEIL